MASAQVKRRQEAGRRKLEEFRKQKAEREKKASQNNTAQPVDNTVADSDGEVAAAASISNGPLSQSPETSFNQTQSKSSSSSSKRDESVGTSSSLELRGSSNDFLVNIRSHEALVPDSNRDKQLSESDGFPKGASFAGSTLLSTSTQMHGSGLISSRKDSLQPTTQESGELRGGGSSIVQKPTLSNSYLFSSRPSDDYGATSYSAKNEATVKRTRPSFLDSLNISRASEIPETSSASQLTVGDESAPSSLQYISGKSDSNGPSSDSPYPYDNFRSPSFPVANGVMPGFTDYSIPKQNDDFSTLEQHIEDLTQEKFSLQRDLDASRALAESLASENSSMTDTYNQQRSIVNQLKDDMEKLHQQIQAQMGELESVRNEYGNAQLECNAADERSQILASEVISLEDKALRLRSNELKLERELESAQAEMSSYKKKLQSLEKDRQDLQSTIKALQEEKKVLQTMVQKASSGGKSTALDKSSTSSKHASTSTEGLAISDTMTGSSNQETDSTDLLGSDLSNTAIIHETGQLTLEGFPLSVPADQMRLIENINTLIVELAIEKEELVQALSTELSQTARVKELNKELSRKLEVQTQRLELLTAQNMAIDNVSPAKQPDSHVVQERPPIADEGDEVVERVLGWIMKMFPGGPSKRRTSKLL
ncbi:protein BLISTER-like [Brassica napus]|uniref:protein BLISTER-like n=1 Tax=Brassica napus TaxID=3708 RepID=UPI002078A037|nr:protein BLISTER-like [Brassica napus]XP_048592495.1 protein BLISTER-like [Brassica napus]